MSKKGNKQKNDDGFDNLLKFELSNLTPDIVNAIWRGDDLVREHRETMNYLTGKIKNDELESILKQMKSISDNIPKLDISTTVHQHPNSNKHNNQQDKQESNKNKSSTVNKKETKSKSKSNKSKSKSKKGKKKSNDSDDDEEMEDEEEEEEEEKSEEEEEDEEELELKELIPEEPQTSNQFIDYLDENKISVQYLSVFLHWMVVHSRNQSIKFNAASIYIRMIVLSRKSFHPFAFRSVLKLFTITKKSPKAKTPFSKPSSKKDEDADGEEEEDDEEEEEEEEKEETTFNQKDWIDDVCNLLNELSWLFYRFSLATFSEPLTNAIESITGLAKTQNFKKPKTKGARASKVVDADELQVLKLSFKVLSILIEENRHGSYQFVLPLVLKEFINTLTLNPSSGTSLPTTVSKESINDRDLTLDFINNTIGSNVNSHDLINILLQHICMRVLDRAEYRNQAVASITSLFINLPSHTRFINNFFITYSKNTKSNFRLFSVEVSLSLLENYNKIIAAADSRDGTSEESGDNDGMLVQQLLSILVNRSSDKVTVVRSKALSCLSILFENQETFQLIKDHLKNVFDLDHYECNANGNADSNGKSDIPHPPVIDSDDEEDGANNNGGNGKSNKKKPSLLSFLSKRSEDDKSQVRKSALQVLEVISIQNGATRPILNILLKKTQDSSPLVRKQVISTLSSLLKSHPDDIAIVDTWRKAVIPLITDRESTIVDRSLDSINEVLFGSILNPKNNSFIWKLLNDVSIEMKPYLHKICGLMFSKKMISTQLIKCVENIIKASKEENIAGGWTLFSEISYCCPDKLDQNLIIGAWNRLKVQVEDKSLTAQQYDDKVSLLCSVLTVIETLCGWLPLELSKSLFNEIYSKVCQFSYDPTITQLFIIILVKLTNRIHKSDQPTNKSKPSSSSSSSSKINTVISDWTKNILAICDEQLSIYALPNLLTVTATKKNDEDGTDGVDGGESTKSINKQSEEKLGLYLFTIGEIIQIPQAKIPSRLKTVVQALIAPTLSTIYNNKTNDGGDDELMITQDDKPIPTSIRAHAFLTLGKLCLGDDRLAKRCIATFAKELEISDSPVIRNNVMVIMCDLCVRYTQLVDNYIPNIAMCLRDQSELVRRQTLILLTRLLQEDYVKWRGSLFFRFVEALVDPSPMVKQFANYCLMNVLQVKYGTIPSGGTGSGSAASNAAANQGNKDNHGNVFFTHFLETIFVLNNCKVHPNYNQISANPAFSLTRSSNNTIQFSHHGQENQDKRMSIYITFLNNMRDEHKFQLMTRLCNDILMEVSEERFNLDDCYGVLHDALSILSCKEIKLKSPDQLKAMAEQDADSNGSEVSTQQVEIEKAKSVLFSSVQKKSLENVVSILIELKHLLEKKRSKLLRLVMIYMKELFKDFKNELSEFLTANRQLEKEIEYDIKNLNRKQIQSPNKQSSVATGGSGVGQSSVTKHHRRSVGGNIVNSPSVGTTPNKPDLTNFLVPQVRTPKPNNALPGSAHKRLSIASSTPTLKPFNQPLGRLSITPMKTPLKQFTDGDSNSAGGSAGGGSNNLFGSNLNNSNVTTPIRSAMRHSIGGIPLSATKNQSLRFNDDTDSSSREEFTIPPPKFTTIPSKLPIRLSIEAKNTLKADIVLADPDHPPTPVKWTIRNDEEAAEEANEEEEEPPVINLKRGRKQQTVNKKLKIIEDDEDQEEPMVVEKPKRSSRSKKQPIVQDEEPPVINLKRGRKQQTVDKKLKIIDDEDQEPEEGPMVVEKPKRSSRSKKQPIVQEDEEEDEVVEEQQEEDEDEDEVIKQKKKRGKTSSTSTTTTKSSSKRKSKK